MWHDAQAQYGNKVCVLGQLYALVIAVVFVADPIRNRKTVAVLLCLGLLVSFFLNWNAAAYFAILLLVLECSA